MVSDQTPVVLGQIHRKPLARWRVFFIFGRRRRRSPSGPAGKCTQLHQFSESSWRTTQVNPTQHSRHERPHLPKLSFDVTWLFWLPPSGLLFQANLSANSIYRRNCVKPSTAIASANHFLPGHTSPTRSAPGKRTKPSACWMLQPPSINRRQSRQKAGKPQLTSAARR